MDRRRGWLDSFSCTIDAGEASFIEYFQVMELIRTDFQGIVPVRNMALQGEPARLGDHVIAGISQDHSVNPLESDECPGRTT
jgi:hypothetical protein